MSATGYEETDLSYHVPDDEEHERGENGEGEEEEEEDIRDLREDGIKDIIREQSASPPRDTENNLRLEESQHHQVPEDIEESRDGGEDGGNQGPPVMTIPPHVLSQILSSPGFSLQVILGYNLHLIFQIPGSEPDYTWPRSSYTGFTTLLCSTSSITLSTFNSTSPNFTPQPGTKAEAENLANATIRQCPA